MATNHHRKSKAADPVQRAVDEGRIADATELLRAEAAADGRGDFDLGERTRDGTDPDTDQLALFDVDEVTR